MGRQPPVTVDNLKRVLHNRWLPWVLVALLVWALLLGSWHEFGKPCPASEPERNFRTQNYKLTSRIRRKVGWSSCFVSYPVGHLRLASCVIG
jgi:hypothetical protein